MAKADLHDVEVLIEQIVCLKRQFSPAKDLGWQIAIEVKPVGRSVDHLFDRRIDGTHLVGKPTRLLVLVACDQCGDVLLQ